MPVTMKDIFDARFSDDPMVRDTAPDLEKMFLLESQVSQATFDLVIANANLSVATLEIQRRELNTSYLESLSLLEELLAKTSEG